MKQILCLLLALVLCLGLLPLTAFAEEGESGILDEEALQAIVESYISEKGLNPDRISVGYVYTATGDTWYYNPDTWYYSASIYKVPLMMLLAQQEYNGEITRETKLKGLTLGYAEEVILTYSHNDYAHLMMSVCADSEPECRDLYKQFADLPDDYYISDFRDYSYFTARFMTQVLTTLYNNQERFPNIIDCLLTAQMDHYFRIYLSKYSIAQKYGSFRDYSNRDWNHTTGVIYTPNPILLTIMTQDAPQPEYVIADLAKRFVDYTLQVDEKLAAYEQEQEALRLAAEEAARQEEEARRLAEEAASLETPPVTEVPALPESETVPTVEPIPTPGSEEIALDPVSVLRDPININGENQRSRLFVLTGAVLVLAAAVLLGVRRRPRG